MIAIEAGNLDGIFILIVLIMLGPPVLLSIVGFAIKKNDPNSAKVLFILAGLYLIIGLGLCGSMIM